MASSLPTRTLFTSARPLVADNLSLLLENSTSASRPDAGVVDDSEINDDDALMRMSTAEVVTFAVVLSILIVITIVGNILVVLSVFTYVPLKTVPNFFVASLACADLAVAILVMPFNVANFVMGRWTFGPIWCLAWLTFDILTCTSSILHLCAIALDRYHAIHDPIAYALQRTRRRVVIKIIVVWTLSAVISVPPLVGWNAGSLYDPIKEECRLTDDRGFVVYSSAGSFYIPLTIMTVVYARIFRATRARLRARARATAAARLRATKTTTTAATVASAAPPAPIGISHVCCGGGSEMKSSPGAGTGNGSMLPSSQPSLDNVAARAAVATGPTSKSEPEPVAADNGHHLSGIGQVASGGVPATSPTVPVGECATVAMLPRYPCQQLQQQQQLTVPRIECDDITGCSSPTLIPRNGRDVGCAGRKNATGTRYSVPKGAPVNRQLYEFMEEKQKISLSKERRAARTMAIIMGAFVACWLPFFLMYVIFPFCNWCEASVDFRVVNFIVWLGYVNSALNPVIYTVFNVDFRRAFQNLLFGRCRLATG